MSAFSRLLRHAADTSVVFFPRSPISQGAGELLVNFSGFIVFIQLFVCAVCDIKLIAGGLNEGIVATSIHMLPA